MSDKELLRIRDEAVLKANRNTLKMADRVLKLEAENAELKFKLESSRIVISCEQTENARWKARWEEFKKRLNNCIRYDENATGHSKNGIFFEIEEVMDLIEKLESGGEAQSELQQKQVSSVCCGKPPAKAKSRKGDLEGTPKPGSEGECWGELKTRLFLAGTAGHNTTIGISDVFNMMEEIEKGNRVVQPKSTHFEPCDDCEEDCFAIGGFQPPASIKKCKLRELSLKNESECKNTEPGKLTKNEY